VRFLTALIACAAVALCQSATGDRQKAGDYPVSAGLLREDLGAEFLVHSIPASGGYYFAKEYLVVDVGVFPRPGIHLAVSSGQFSLRLNGGNGLMAQSPGAVAASLKYPDWNGQRGLSGTMGIPGGPNATVSTSPAPVGRFPGDPRVGNGPNGSVQSDEDQPERQVEMAALPDAITGRPLKGCLFFASDIKATKIKSLELEWTGPEGDHAVLKLK
jgi:hypothetical protein